MLSGFDKIQMSDSGANEKRVKVGGWRECENKQFS
jgi:hypothetical protein